MDSVTSGSRTARHCSPRGQHDGAGGPDFDGASQTESGNPGSSNLDWRSKMKLKSLLFGSAAVLAAGTGAQAADLPTAEPVEYVRICDAFGAGFHYIPGTDTCLAIGGRVRVDASYVDGDVFERFAVPTADFNNFSTRARADVDFDARTQTDFGLIRAFIAYRMQIGTDNSSLGDPNYGEQAELIAAFIQISNDMG